MDSAVHKGLENNVDIEVDVHTDDLFIYLYTFNFYF